MMMNLPFSEHNKSSFLGSNLFKFIVFFETVDFLTILLSLFKPVFSSVVCDNKFADDGDDTNNKSLSNII